MYLEYNEILTQKSHRLELCLADKNACLMKMSIKIFYFCETITHNRRAPYFYLYA